MSPSVPSRYGPAGPPRLERRALVRLWAGIGGLVVLLAIAALLSRLAAGPPPSVYGTGSAKAATYGWDGADFTRLSTASPGPSSNEADMAFDRRSGEVVLWDHGCTRLVMGFTGGCQGVADQTWTWDGRAWRARRPGHSPRAVEQGAMFYDAKVGEVVYLNRLGEAWAWTGADWRSLALAGEPRLTAPGSVAGSGQMLVAAGYDEGTDRLVLALPGATWTWDGTRWAQGAGGVDAADAQSDPRAVFDDSLGRLLYLGRTRLWTWDGSRWQSSSQPGLAGAALAYQPAARTAVAIAEDSSSCDRATCAAAVWTWDGSSWSRLNPGRPPALPLSRSGVTDLPLAFDEARGVLLLFVSAA